MIKNIKLHIVTDIKHGDQGCKTRNDHPKENKLEKESCLPRVGVNGFMVQT